MYIIIYDIHIQNLYSGFLVVQISFRVLCPQIKKTPLVTFDGNFLSFSDFGVFFSVIRDWFCCLAG